MCPSLGSMTMTRRRVADVERDDAGRPARLEPGRRSSSVRNRSTPRSPVVRSTDHPRWPSMRTDTGCFAVTSFVVAKASTMARAVVGVSPRPRPFDRRSVTELAYVREPSSRASSSWFRDEFAFDQPFPTVNSIGGSNADDRYRPASSQQARPRNGSQTGDAATGALVGFGVGLAVGLAVGFAVGFGVTLGRAVAAPPGARRRSRPTPPGPAAVPLRREGRQGPSPAPRRAMAATITAAMRRPRPDRRLAWLTRDGRRAAADPAVPRLGVLDRTVGSPWPTSGSRNPAIAAPLEKRDSGSGARARRTTASRSIGTSPRTSRGEGAGLPTRASASGRACRPTKADAPSAPRTSRGPGRRCPRPAWSRHPAPAPG